MKKALDIGKIGADVDVVAEVKPRIARALSNQETKSSTAVRHCTLWSQVGK